MRRRSYRKKSEIKSPNTDDLRSMRFGARS